MHRLERDPSQPREQRPPACAALVGANAPKAAGSHQQQGDADHDPFRVNCDVGH